MQISLSVMYSESETENHFPIISFYLWPTVKSLGRYFVQSENEKKTKLECAYFTFTQFERNYRCDDSAESFGIQQRTQPICYQYDVWMYWFNEWQIELQ